MSLRREWPYLIGAGVVLGMLGLLITRRDPLGSGVLVEPVGPSPAKPSDPPGNPHWIEIDAPFRLFTDDLYRATISVPFGAGFLVTKSKIIEGATKMGFRDVVVIDDDAELPADWPGDRKGDRFVQATWGLEDRIVAGDSHITHAFRKTRA